MSKDDEIRRTAWLKEKWELDRRAWLIEATEKGTKQGMKKGLKEGLEQGIEQGIQEGEKNKSIEIAKNMLSKNLDINLISELTGLSKEEIEKLK